MPPPELPALNNFSLLQQVQINTKNDSTPPQYWPWQTTPAMTWNPWVAQAMWASQMAAFAGLVSTWGNTAVNPEPGTAP